MDKKNLNYYVCNDNEKNNSLSLFPAAGYFYEAAGGFDAAVRHFYETAGDFDGVYSIKWGIFRKVMIVRRKEPVPKGHHIKTMGEAHR